MVLWLVAFASAVVGVGWATLRTHTSRPAAELMAAPPRRFARMIALRLGVAMVGIGIGLFLNWAIDRGTFGDLFVVLLPGFSACLLVRAGMDIARWRAAQNRGSTTAGLEPTAPSPTALFQADVSELGLTEPERRSVELWRRAVQWAFFGFAGLVPLGFVAAIFARGNAQAWSGPPWSAAAVGAFIALEILAMTLLEFAVRRLRALLPETT